MTDTPTSPTDPSDDDLLASLYLDGEATAEERARVESSPALMARVREFERLAADLADVSPPPDLARIQISAALDLFDQQSGPDRSAASPAAALGEAPVASLAERRERKARAGVPTWLSAAAALALVVGGIGFVASRSNDASDDSTAMESVDTVSASGADRSTDATDAAESMMETEAFEEELMEDDAMEDDAMEESAEADVMADEPMEDADAMEEEADLEADNDSADDEGADDGGEEAAADSSAIPLDGLEATVAADFLEAIEGEARQPIAESPCAGSPVLDDLGAFDQFVPVVFNEQLSSLLVQSADPTAAVIIGPTCEVELQ